MAAGGNGTNGAKAAPTIGDLIVKWTGTVRLLIVVFCGAAVWATSISKQVDAHGDQLKGIEARLQTISEKVTRLVTLEEERGRKKPD